MKIKANVHLVHMYVFIEQIHLDIIINYVYMTWEPACVLVYVKILRNSHKLFKGFKLKKRHIFFFYNMFTLHSIVCLHQKCFCSALFIVIVIRFHVTTNGMSLAYLSHFCICMKNVSTISKKYKKERKKNKEKL